MKKEEFIAKYGIAAYGNIQVHSKGWNDAHPEEVVAFCAEQCHKGGKYHIQQQEYIQNGISGEKHSIRNKHRKMWRRFKNIIAPGSQIHHEWLNDGTPNYRGVALVEADQHMDGDIDVIHILEGNITLFTEAEIRSQEVM